MPACSGTPLARKPGIAPGMHVRFLDPPDGCWSLLGDEITTGDVAALDPTGGRPVATRGRGGSEADFTHLFATDSARRVRCARPPAIASWA
jgi:hypothetical protein